MDHDDPIAVIANGTGETRDEVAAALLVIGELGYSFDETWTYCTAAVAGRTPLAEIAANLPKKQTREDRRANARHARRRRGSA